MMNLVDLANMFQRAFALTLCKKKLLLSSLAIAVSGLFGIFCMGLAFSANAWMSLSLQFLPIFITGMALMGFGVILIRSYHDEVKHQEMEVTTLFLRSWDVIFSAASAFLLIVLSYLVLWLSLGLFFVLKELPFIGELFACFFVFIPFLLNLSAILLAFFSIYALFVMSPTLALKPIVPQNFLSLARFEFTSHVFLRLAFFVGALLPFAVSLILIAIAASITLQMVALTTGPLQVVVQWFFLLIPSALLLAPSLVFFFNMAAESHVLIHRIDSETGK